MKPRYPEKKEEKAMRIARAAASMAGSMPGALESAGTRILALPAVLEQRMAARLTAAAPTMHPGAAAALAATMASDGHATAQMLARGDVRAADLTDDALANLESVIRVSDRPAWYVHKGVPTIDPEDRKDGFWIVLATAAVKKMRSTCSGVGSVMKEHDGARVAIGTGWMIAAGTLVTNAHVAGHLAIHKPGVPADDPRGGWRLRPDVRGVVDFAFERGGGETRRIEIAQVLYVESAVAPDIAIFRLEPADTPTSPPVIKLDLAAERAAGWPGTYVFTVGHPIADLQDDANAQTVFGPLDGTKRVSPGQLMAILGGATLTHDCSTTNGSSGSPVIDFASYQAVGLHYFGKPSERNEAVFLAAVKDHPAIVKSKSQNWGI